MDAYNDEDADAGRIEERDTDRVDTEKGDDECEIRKRPTPKCDDECEIRKCATPKSPVIQSEGAEGSLRVRQSRKHLLYDPNEGNDEL